MSEAVAEAWYVYLVECNDGTLYTGVARDVERRLAQHNTGCGARYTRGRGPVTLVARSAPLDKRTAHRREAAIKKLPRHRKADAVAVAVAGVDS